MPKLSHIPKDKNSLQLFIENCCKLSTFEQDNIVVTTFTEQYEQFLTLNHLPKQQASGAEMQKLFNITSKYIPQQWVVRDDTTIPKEEDDAKDESFMVRTKKTINTIA